MKATLGLILGVTFAAVSCTVIHTTPGRRLADDTFLKRQRQILDLFIGIGSAESWSNQYIHFNLKERIGDFEKPEVVREFLEAYQNGFLPIDEVFSFQCNHTVQDLLKLYNVFYYAKSFDTFYKVASWARKNIHSTQFSYAFFYALSTRTDCQYFQLPALPEISPQYFIPMKVLHQIYEAKMLGVKDRRFTFNNTGYEYTYYERMYNGPFSSEYQGGSAKISYLMDDVGGSAWYAWALLSLPHIFKEVNKFRSGEALYFRHQQIFARHINALVANGLPFIERLDWDLPIKNGYNPKIVHYNGEAFDIRPDNVVPSQLNRKAVEKVQILEKRILDLIDAAVYFEASNNSVISLNNNDGIDLLGRVMFGLKESPNKAFFGNYFQQAMDTLAHLSRVESGRKYIGGAASLPVSALRDPIVLQFFARLVGYFQYHKEKLPRYTRDELNLRGVKIEEFEVDKLVTYMEHREFEVTNAIPLPDIEHYKQFGYYVKQHRLNHKPFNFRLTLSSDKERNALVRLYVGPKFDHEGHELAIEQRRLAFYLIDRFAVNLVSGENVIERNSRESPLFSPEPEGIRSLYAKINNALYNSEPYYYTKRPTCGLPYSQQLPRGSKKGTPFTFAIIITPFRKLNDIEQNGYYIPCEDARFYDSKPYGFPFDRPLDGVNLNVPNICFKDVHIFHKEGDDAS